LSKGVDGGATLLLFVGKHLDWTQKKAEVVLIWLEGVQSPSSFRCSRSKLFSLWFIPDTRVIHV